MHAISIESIHVGIKHIAIGVFVDSADTFEQRIGSHDVTRLHEHDEIAFHGSHARRKAFIDTQRLVGFHHVDAIAVERIFQIGGFTTRRSSIDQNELPAAIALERNRVHEVVNVVRWGVVKHANDAEKRLVIETGCHLFEQIRNIGAMLLHKPLVIFGVKRRARCLLVEFGNERFESAIAQHGKTGSHRRCRIGCAKAYLRVIGIDQEGKLDITTPQSAIPRALRDGILHDNRFKIESAPRLIKEIALDHTRFVVRHFQQC